MLLHVFFLYSVYIIHVYAYDIIPFQFEEVVQYVINEYPDYPVEDLIGDKSLLTVLSTPLAVTVARSHCSVIFTLKHAPALMRQGICPEKVGKLTLWYQHCSVCLLL